MRPMTALSCLVFLALTVQTALSIPVSIAVVDKERNLIGNAQVIVYLIDGTPVDSGTTSASGVFQTFLNESLRYDIIATKSDASGRWSGSPGPSITILITKSSTPPSIPWS